MSNTLVLDRVELRKVVDVPLLVNELRAAMRCATAGTATRVRAPVSPNVTAMVLAPGQAPGIPAYTVKVHAKNRHRHPAITGVICMHDAATGDLLAIMDSGWLTALRTAACSALATDLLARPDATDIGVIGCGTQGRAQLLALLELRNPTSLHLHDINAQSATELAHVVRARHGLRATVHQRTSSLMAECNVVLSATWARAPLIAGPDALPGTHITSLGADEPGKLEVAPEVLQRSLVVTDDIELASSVLPRIDTTVGDVLRGSHAGRTHRDEMTVFSPVGLPLQDCVAAWHAYRAAVEAGVGTPMDLERANR